MAKHKNPLEKEFLIRQYKNNPTIKMSDFCERNGFSTGAFQKWIKQYEELGVEGLEEQNAFSCGTSKQKSAFSCIIKFLFIAFS